MEKLTRIELAGVEMHETWPRGAASETSSMGITQEDDVYTGNGRVHVCVQGERGKPAIFTYHDIGLNSKTCFEGFFSYDELQPILNRFTVYHLNAPGHEEGAGALPSFRAYQGNNSMQSAESDTLISFISQSEDSDPAAKRTTSTSEHGSTPDVSFSDYVYPTMDQLADMIMPVLQYYGLKTFIGLGVGAGANVLSRFALHYPDKVDALALINCSASTSSWTEWGFQKWNSWYLKSGMFTASTENYLLWHYFGSKTLRQNYDLVQMFDNYIHSVNPHNMGLFIDAYIKRTDLGIEREFDPRLQKESPHFTCPVMLVAGQDSPHLDEVIAMNSRLDPANSTWMKFECGGMVHEEAPSKLTEAFHLFLQGLGYNSTLRLRKK